MPQSDVVVNGRLVDEMRYAIMDGEKSIKHIPDFVRRVLETEAWKHRLVGKLPVKHKTFRSFVFTAPLDGMGWGSEEDQKMIESLLREDQDVRTMWREAVTLEPGENQYTMVHDNVMHHEKAVQGNSLGYTLDRLKRDHEALFKRVVAKELSANAAAIEAGFRKRVAPFEQIVKLLPKLTSNERRKLRRLLETGAT